MTTDFLVTVRQQGQPTLLARTIKPRADLSKRTLEKFEIERRFWAMRDVSWQIVTDQELSPIFTDNMHRLHAAYFPDPAWTPDLLAATTAVLTAALHAPTSALATLALACDRRLGQIPGTSLGIIYHLVATKQWEADLFAPLDPARTFTLIAEGPTFRLFSL